MSESKDDPLDGKDRAEWDRAWKGRPQRHVPSPSQIELPPGFTQTFGEVPAALIVLDSPEFGDVARRDSDLCVLCREPTTEPERLAATLHPSFAREINLGIAVWVHPACFEKCPEAKGPDLRPW